MESPPVFLAGPFPVLHSSRVVEEEDEVELDVGLIIQGQPTILASTCFALDADWSRIKVALASGDAQLGVAGMPYVDEEEAVGRTYPSAYIGLQCANGERLVLTHIRGMDASMHAEAYAKDVIQALLNGLSPDELGETIE